MEKNSMVRDKIRERIKILMDANPNFNADGFAQALGKRDRQSYYDFFKAKSVDVQEVFLIADYLGVSPEKLLFDERINQTPRPYLEDRVSDLEQKVEEMYKIMRINASSLNEEVKLGSVKQLIDKIEPLFSTVKWQENLLDKKSNSDK